MYTMTDTNMSVPQVLRDAAGILRAQGDRLARGGFRDIRINAVCMQGAIGQVVAGTPDIWSVDSFDEKYNNLIYVATESLASTLPDRCEHDAVLEDLQNRVYHFNDQHCDSGVQAAEILEQAAEKFEARETVQP